MEAQLKNGAVLATADEAQDLVASILRASTEYSMIGKDLEGRIMLWNEGARRIYGYEPEEIVGRDSAVLHSHEDVQEGQPRAILEAALREGKWEGTLARRRKNGETFQARMVVTPRRDPSGRPVGFLTISKDISEEIRLAQELQASQARDRILASMSHELRTPLNAIIGFTGTLLMRLPGPLTADQEKQLKTVQTSARHLLSLINDILDLAKIESGRVEVRPEPVICQGVVDEVSAAIRPLAEAKGLVFEVARPEEEVVVSTDRRALCQILLNLAQNAVKYTDRGAVTLRLDRRQEAGSWSTEFSVSDTGRGIAPADQVRLFQAFSQLKPAPSSRPEGAGLGLYLCQKLARLIGGSITLQSEPGQGSTFTLSLRGYSRFPEGRRLRVSPAARD